MRPTGSETAEADTPSCAKGRGWWPGTSKWRERVHMEAKSKCLVNKCLPCLTEKAFWRNKVTFGNSSLWWRLSQLLGREGGGKEKNLPSPLFLKNNQPKAMLMSKRYMLGWQILLPNICVYSWNHQPLRSREKTLPEPRSPFTPGSQPMPTPPLPPPDNYDSDLQHRITMILTSSTTD